jgi:Sulfotransferase family/Glycosyltransferase sugar-binding region containing DXD motif
VLIPTIFHQIWLGPDPLPDEYAGYQQTWLQHHPGWELRLWTEENLPEGLRRPEAYERLRAPAERANVLRLELLWRLGGVYVDTDFACLRSIEPLIDDAELFITLAKPGRVNNALMGSVPSHPIVEEAMEKIRPVEFFGHDKARTGTRFLDGLLIDRPGVTLLDAELFYSDDPAAQQRAFGVHHKSRSWKDAELLRIDLERAERKIVAQREVAAKRKLRYQRAEAELDRLRRTWPRRIERVARTAVGRGEPRAFCLFIGYPRSGHSLIGSLLDAHPDVVIAHEVNVLKLVADEGVSRRELFETLREHADAEAMRPLGRRSSGYSYAVPGQWQGSVRRLRVIGSKHGDRTSSRLGRNPEELGLLKRRVRVPLRLLHVTRNPYDMIARMASMTRGGTPERTVADAVEHVERLARVNEQVIARERVLTVRHEEFVADPGAGLRRICDFLRVEPEPEWLQACARLVFPSPQQARDVVEWTAEDREAVERLISAHDFFAGYGWES